MRTSDAIRFDFQTAMNEAGKLDDIANTIEKRVAGGMEHAEQNVHVLWQGTSATHYIGQAQELRGQVEKTVQELRLTAEEIRRIARRMYEAEMRALEIAQRHDS